MCVNQANMASWDDMSSTGPAGTVHATYCTPSSLQRYEYVQDIVYSLSTFCSDGCSPTVSEPELYRSVQVVLPRDMDNQQPQDNFNKGTTQHSAVLYVACTVAGIGQVSLFSGGEVATALMSDLLIMAKAETLALCLFCFMYICSLIATCVTDPLAHRWPVLFPPWLNCYCRPSATVLLTLQQVYDVRSCPLVSHQTSFGWAVSCRNVTRLAHLCSVLWKPCVG